MHLRIARWAAMLLVVLGLGAGVAVAGDPPPAPPPPPTPPSLEGPPAPPVAGPPQAPPAPPPARRRWHVPLGDLGPVPPGARLTFEIEGGTTHQVGDELAASFVIHNDGTEAFRAVEDGSGSRRGHEHLEATDEAGSAVLDPVTSGFSGNGPMGPRTVDPGGSLRVKGIPHLGRYLRFDRPGTFRIRASIDLGWTDTPEHSNPVVEVTLVLTRPTPEEAAAIVARRIAEKRAGEAKPPGRWIRPRLQDLYDPVYVPALVEAVAQGELDAVEGLRSIDDPSAIDALSAATQSRDGAIVRDAARALSSTVPAVGPEADAAAHRQLPRRAALSALLAARVRERMAALLSETGDAWTAASAAEVLVRVGAPDDLPAITRFLDRWVPLLPTLPIQNVRTRPTARAEVAPRSAFIQAARTLLARGASAPTDPRFAGEILVYLVSLELPDRARPADADDRCLAWLSHRVPAVRAAALRALSPSGLERAIVYFEALAGFGDAEVALSAFRAFLPLAAKCRTGPALAAVRTSTDRGLLEVAAKMADAQGARTQLVDTWVGRLAEDEMLRSALEGLVELLVLREKRGSGGTNRLKADELTSLQAAWRAFVIAHAQEIRDGKQWALGDPALTPELFGRALHFRLADGTQWPPRK